MEMGVGADASRLFIEMGRAFNDGLLTFNRPRTQENTTSTSIEEFADTFAQAYRAQAMHNAA